MRFLAYVIAFVLLFWIVSLLWLLARWIQFVRAEHKAQKEIDEWNGRL